MSLLIQLHVRLGHMVIILLIRSHIYDLVGNPGILGIRLVNLAVRRLDKTVLVDSRVACQRVDQTDVRSLGGLNGAHSSVMGIMYISHLESRTVSGQTSGSQCRQTSLVGQLAQRVVLIHELGQLGGSEELLYRSGYRFDIDQSLGRDNLHILRGHTLPYHTLQSGETDAILVLQQLAHRADTAVAQMIDIIVVTDVIFQMHVIVNGRENIVPGNMLGNQVVDIPADRRLDILFRLVLLENLSQHRIVYQFRNAQRFGFTVHIVGNIHHHVGENLHVSGLRLNPHIGDCRVLDLIRQLTVHLRTGFRKDFSGGLIHHILGEDHAVDPIAQHQLLVEFITSHLCQIITPGIKEHGVDQALGALHRQRLAGTDLAVQF